MKQFKIVPLTEEYAEKIRKTGKMILAMMQLNRLLPAEDPAVFL